MIEVLVGSIDMAAIVNSGRGVLSAGQAAAKGERTAIGDGRRHITGGHDELAGEGRNGCAQ